MRSSVIINTFSDSASFGKGVGLSEEGPMAGAVCSRLRGGPGARSISSLEGICGLVWIDCGVWE